MTAAEAGFVSQAASYGQRKGIALAMRREFGVAADMLTRAGITRLRLSKKLDTGQSQRPSAVAIWAFDKSGSTSGEANSHTRSDRSTRAGSGPLRPDGPPPRTKLAGHCTLGRVAAHLSEGLFRLISMSSAGARRRAGGSCHRGLPYLFPYSEARVPVINLRCCCCGPLSCCRHCENRLRRKGS